MSDKNPTIIPTAHASNAPRCPKCKHDSFNGRNVGGVITFTCAKCKNQWQGGIGQVPEDPTIPRPPVNPNDKPTITFVKNANDEIVERRRPVSTVPNYRKGLPIPPGDE